jgi:hypothetical protein
MKKIIYSIAVCLITLNACSDFLDIPSHNLLQGSDLSEDNLPQLTAPLYTSVWFDFNGQFYYGLGDGASYNLYAPYSNYIYPFADFSVTGLTGPLVDAWKSFYVVIQQSNKVIKAIDESSAPDDLKNQYKGEARFMRGIAYWYLASLWQNAIITEDPDAIVANPVVPLNPRKDVYEYAIRDLEFAARYLPATAQAGRVTRYSAFGMLSRVYLAYSGLAASNSGENAGVGVRDEAYLELARKAAGKVIDESQYKLMDNYADLYLIENNNNPESMFAFQWVGGLTSETGYGYINTQQAYFAYGSEITGDNAAWGGWTRATYDVIKEYEPNDTIRRRATWMGAGDFYPEISKAAGGLAITNDAAHQQYLNVKKGVTGSPKDNPGIGRMNSALNTYMLRLAEVYLNYAEAVLGNSASTNDGLALKYFNLVRSRAKMPEKSSISYSDLRYERRVEFCMEGLYWYDLLNRSYYRQQEVIDYLIGQHREEIVPFLFQSPNSLQLDDSRDAGTRAVGRIDKSVFRLPYPSDEIIQNPLLGKDPVPFNFTEERITDLFN